MPLPAGILREMFAIESPTETRNALGETIQNWTEIAKRPGSYEAISYFEQLRRGQIYGTCSATVRMRYFKGLNGKCRLRWISRENRILYISSIVENGTREEHELVVEEQNS
jgi:head-tail adaptor